MTLKIFHNELDATDCTERSYTCLLTEWLQVREQYPTARLYKDSICLQNDITPKTKADAWALKDVTGDYQVLCHAGDPLTLGIIAAVISVGVAVYTYYNMPEVNAPQDVSGSPNNSLAQRQNKHRVGERVPTIYGKRKVIPDLISPVYRYYSNNVQVEECLLCVGSGWFSIDENTIDEGETPVNTIEGASLSVYEPNQSLVSPAPQIQIGGVFDELPIVTKQVSSIDGKQSLVPPNSGKLIYHNINILETGEIKADGYAYMETIRFWSNSQQDWVYLESPRTADFTGVFSSGEGIIIENAIYGAVEDAVLSGNSDISMDGVLTIASTRDITNPDAYKKIKISALLIDDVTNGKLDLAGDYDVDSIVKTGGSGNYFYEVTLSPSYNSSNPTFSLMTADAVGVVASVLTKNESNIDLSGQYTVGSTSPTSITLVNPSAVNSDWNRVSDLTAQQKSEFLKRKVTFRGSADNWIGWYYAGNKDSTGFIVNFLAQNGIYEEDRAKQVAIEIEYQMIVNEVPTGQVFRYGDIMQGVANNRNPIGLTMRQELPNAGKFRFRVKRENDNGSGSSLIDDVVFESAYSYYQTKKSVYEHDTIVRLKRMAIGSGTNASELNMEAHRKLNTPDGFLPTSNFADIAIDMALDQYNGRMSPSEVDSNSFYDLSAEIAAYFGTDKACEFNYTFDDKYSSYQEMIFTVAEAVFCTARREGGLHYFNFERETPNSLALFNHRNIAPESMVITEFFGVQDNYDGIEFKWRDPSDNYGEAIIRLPDELRTNYKTIESQGVTNNVQAHFLANRAWNKLKYNRKAIEFTAYGEGDLVTRMDRIAVVDSTVPILCSGQIENQENTVLTLDYPVSLDAGKNYVIHLQLKNSTVDVIEIVGQLNDYQIQVARIPALSLVTDGVTHAVFNITEADNTEYDAYLISEKSSKALFESTISAMSYDSRYYPNDKDYINGLIT
ncbi:hypothetical protein J3492_00330 [Psychrobacter sp. F1192]|uniref:Tail protein n=1 Tax=Psychrobacter coccoides TaxID=2818440 RepID=A0ABS3NJU1_9GAMM|nr:host specificity factor TipJ family phage tail protein [Psychrobacter coccoides]MBO1529660.1 hypothetical protein [Psychrobacter coccoides]